MRRVIRRLRVAVAFHVGIMGTAISLVALASATILPTAATAEGEGFQASIVAINVVPQPAQCGQKITVTVFVKNTGHAAWVPKGEHATPKISVVVASRGGIVSTPLPGTTFPGETEAFEVSFPAPNTDGEFDAKVGVTQLPKQLAESDFSYTVECPENLVVAPTANPDQATAGGTVVFNSGANGGTGGDSYDWTVASEPTGATDQLVNPLTGNPYLIPQKAGTYVINEKVTDSAGDTATGSVTFTANPAPEVSISVRDNPDDVGLTTDLPITVTGGTGPDTVSSQISSSPPGNTAQLSNSDSLDPTLDPNTPGAYVITSTATDANGVSSPPVTVTVNVNPNPTATILLDTAAPTVKQPVDVSALPGGGTGAFTMSWQLTTPPGSSAALTSSKGLLSGFTPDVPGLYVVSLTVTDALGVTSTPATESIIVPFPSSCTAPSGGTCEITAASGAGLLTIEGTASVTVTDATTGTVVGIFFGPTHTFIANVGDNYILSNSSGSPASVST
jgi:hypothetical protein